ncbi:hypothetical protein [Alterisphingorhabdus coralli]|uniref:Uncharacterized protein n=1 Tax=Alterisphingorhabdus coralli TaxID=3071408 RepID=A0AA97F9T1_9SPHN|nr:hypothetical protein [Parasphingorhabdus sp. SCSIO 66989]WOE76161.1 hypothetical protein RB602_05455 [Parasphingorhabdus sp. SCSIO 66989]
MGAAALRKTLRWLHIIGGLILGTYLYSPWGSDPVFTFATLYIIIPAMAISGIWMWQQAAISRLFRRQAKS